MNGAETGNVIVGASSTTVTKGFTITPSAITSSNTIAFTEVDTGNTKVSIYNGSTYDALDATTEANKVVSCTLKATIGYSGNINVKASIQALWQRTVTDVKLRQQCTAVDQTSTNRAPVSGTAATTDIRFTTGISDYSDDCSNLISLASSDFIFGDPTGSSSPYAVATAEVTVGTVYVALTGSDSLVVDATHMQQYILTVDASQSA